MLKESPAATFACQHVARLDSALERLRQEAFDVVLLDLGLPDSQGITTLTLTQEASGASPIVVLTGLDDERCASEAIRAGAQDYLVKGRFDTELLARTIRYAVERKGAEEEVRRLNAELERRVAERTAELQAANNELLKEGTQRTHVERALRFQEQRLAAVIDHAMDAIITVDEEQRVVLFNAAAEKIFRCSASEAIGHPLDRFLPERARAVHHGHIQRYSATGTSACPTHSPGMVYGRRTNGEEFPLEATISQATIGQHRLFTAILRDVTSRTQAEEIARLYDQSKELDRLKTDFFANISHELRTPLALILGPVRKRLAAGGMSDADRRDLELVERNAGLMLRRVNDLLDLSKLDAGRMTAEYESIDLARQGKVVASYFEGVANERGLQYLLDIPDSLAAQGDLPKLERVFVNLLSNAVKFTPAGGTVRFAIHQDGNRAVVEVQDTGPGIPPHMREAIFERFRQIETGAGRRFGGTGLGLTIARQFVSLHGGSISVGDAPGSGGSLFRVELPLSAPPGTCVRDIAEELSHEGTRQASGEVAALKAPPARSSPSPAPSAPVVLVIEDNPDMNAFISEVLSACYRTVPAFDGQDGLNKALSLRPDLILCDIVMPDMSGDELVRTLRKCHELDEVPIVLLTALADDSLLVQLLMDGAQDYLRKPLAAEQLCAKIDRLIADRRRVAEEVERLHQLAERLLQVDDQHRRHVAYQLHEDIAQCLAAVRMTLSLARGSSDGTGRETRRLIAEGLALLEQVCLDICAMSYALHPSLLEGWGLQPAIESHVQSFASRSGIEVSVEIAPGFGRLNAELELVLFRIMQEALSNVRDSGRTKATVRVFRDAAEIGLEVRGKGYRRALEEHTPDHSVPGASIAGMRERARMVGGRLEISDDEDGNTLSAVFPY
jgi:PAS domain S-box-containing protein